MPRRCPRTTRAARPSFEVLEPRALPATLPWPGLSNPVVEAEGNDTLNLAQDLGNVSAQGRLEAAGTIGDGANGASDVDWYRFTLAAPSRVQVRTLNRLGHSDQQSVLGLYGSNPTDPTNATYQFRLLAQDDGAARDGDAVVEYTLGAGTYWVAVSGSGNRYFHPHLAGSGLEGSKGDYGLLVTSAELATVPLILSTDPADGAVLAGSPLAVRARLSAALTNGETITLRDADDNVIPVTTNFNATIRETRLVLRQALPMGTYRISLRGSDDLELEGVSFTVNGVEGQVNGGQNSNDATAGAIELGDLTQGGLLQRTGAVGDDPFYDPSSTDPQQRRQASDVDLYHFSISGPGRYSLVSEVFSQRLGLGLNSGLSLYRRTADGTLELIAGNDNTFNSTRSTLNTTPLNFDPALFAGLTAGDYYLAVSATGNVPDPLLNRMPGANGLFDPNVAHSGTVGTGTGAYVLNLRVESDNESPQVTATTPVPGETLAAAPTLLTVKFSEPVNLQYLGYARYQQTPGSVAVPAVFVRGSDGVDYTPRFVSYDPATFQATFLMLTPVPNGVTELHLSASLGLTDLAGNPLVGNTPSGDYVVSFTVNAPARGSAAGPRTWYANGTNDQASAAQDLGTLFPLEFEQGVIFRRDLAANPVAPSDTSDFYRFEVLQQRIYIFTMPSSTGLPPGTRPRLVTPTGTVINVTLGAPITLAAGRYTLEMTGWSSADAENVKYDLRVSLGTSAESPTPLSSGAAPALSIRLSTAAVTPQATPSPATPATPGAPPVSGTTGTFAAGGATGSVSAGVLLSLRAGPVGGESGAARMVDEGAAERLVLLDAGGPTGGALRTLTVTLTLLGGGDEGPEMEGAFPEAMKRLWKELFEGLQWLGGGWAPIKYTNDPAVTTPTESVVDQIFHLQGQEDILWSPDAEACGLDEPTTAISESLLPWLALGALALRASAGHRRLARNRALSLPNETR